MVWIGKYVDEKVSRLAPERMDDIPQLEEENVKK
jgi:hypothetical protein